MLALIIRWAGLAVAALLILRMIFHWLNLNPFSWPVYTLRRWTEPLVRPLRGMAGPVLSFDLIPLVMAIFVATTGLFLSGILLTAADIIRQASTAPQSPRDFARYLIQILVFAYTILIFLRVIFPMFRISYYSRFARFTFQATEPLLRPLRRHFSRGMFDFSPLIALVLVQIAGYALTRMIGG